MFHRISQRFQILIKVLIHIYIIRIKFIIGIRPLVYRLNDLVYFYDLLYCFRKIREYSNLMSDDQSVSHRYVSRLVIEKIYRHAEHGSLDH